MSIVRNVSESFQTRRYDLWIPSVKRSDQQSFSRSREQTGHCRHGLSRIVSFSGIVRRDLIRNYDAFQTQTSAGSSGLSVGMAQIHSESFRA